MWLTALPEIEPQPQPELPFHSHPEVKPLPEVVFTDSRQVCNQAPPDPLVNPQREELPNVMSLLEPVLRAIDDIKTSLPPNTSPEEGHKQAATEIKDDIKGSLPGIEISSAQITSSNRQAVQRSTDRAASFEAPQKISSQESAQEPVTERPPHQTTSDCLQPVIMSPATADLSERQLPSNLGPEVRTPETPASQRESDVPVPTQTTLPQALYDGKTNAVYQTPFNHAVRCTGPTVEVNEDSNIDTGSDDEDHQEPSVPVPPPPELSPSAGNEPKLEDYEDSQLSSNSSPAQSINDTINVTAEQYNIAGRPVLHKTSKPDTQPLCIQEQIKKLERKVDARINGIFRSIRPRQQANKKYRNHMSTSALNPYVIDVDVLAILSITVTIVTSLTMITITKEREKSIAELTQFPVSQCQLTRSKKNTSWILGDAHHLTNSRPVFRPTPQALLNYSKR